MLFWIWTLGILIWAVKNFALLMKNGMQSIVVQSRTRLTRHKPHEYTRANYKLLWIMMAQNVALCCRIVNFQKCENWQQSRAHYFNLYATTRRFSSNMKLRTQSEQSVDDLKVVQCCGLSHSTFWMLFSSRRINHVQVENNCSFLKLFVATCLRTVSKLERCCEKKYRNENVFEL